MKYLTIISLAASFFLISEASSAKTQGSYITAEALKTHVRFYERYYNDNNLGGTRERVSHQGTDNYGAGLSYKFAFNYRGLFFAPGIFAEKHEARSDGFISTSGRDWQRMEIRNRYGIKSDIGFDLGIVAPYLTGGYSSIAYRNRNFNKNSVSSGGINKGNAKDFFYGAGFKIDIPRTYISLNFEYNANNFYAKTNTNPATNNNNFKAEFRTKFDIFKLGFSYNF